MDIVFVGLYIKYSHFLFDLHIFMDIFGYMEYFRRIWQTDGRYLYRFRTCLGIGITLLCVRQYHLYLIEELRTISIICVRISWPRLLTDQSSISSRSTSVPPTINLSTERSTISPQTTRSSSSTNILSSFVLGLFPNLRLSNSWLRISINDWYKRKNRFKWYYRRDNSFCRTRIWSLIFYLGIIIVLWRGPNIYIDSIIITTYNGISVVINILDRYNITTIFNPWPYY